MLLHPLPAELGLRGGLGETLSEPFSAMPMVVPGALPPTGSRHLLGNSVGVGQRSECAIPPFSFQPSVQSLTSARLCCHLRGSPETIAKFPTADTTQL